MYKKMLKLQWKIHIRSSFIFLTPLAHGIKTKRMKKISNLRFKKPISIINNPKSLIEMLPRLARQGAMTHYKLRRDDTHEAQKR
jgi:hypothetical protein